MLTAADLRAAFTTAFQHLKSGGVFLTCAEVTLERFRQNKTLCSTHSRGDIEITFIENYYDPDPADTIYQATFVYLVRRGGQLEIETDCHLCGIFELETWRSLLKEVGFGVHQMEFTIPGSEGEAYPILVGSKPL